MKTQEIPLSFEMRMSNSNSLHEMNTVAILDGDSVIYPDHAIVKTFPLFITVWRRALTPSVGKALTSTVPSVVILATASHKSRHFICHQKGS